MENWGEIDLDLCWLVYFWHLEDVGEMKRTIVKNRKTEHRKWQTEIIQWQI